MSDIFRQAASSEAWSAGVPLILFMTFFVGVVIWTWRQPDEAPPLE